MGRAITARDVRKAAAKVGLKKIPKQALEQAATKVNCWRAAR